jgi:hypothetical protein
MRVDPFLPKPADDVEGRRQIVNGFELSLAPSNFIETGAPSILIPAEGGFVSFSQGGSLVSRAQSPGSNSFLSATGLLVSQVPILLDQDSDTRLLPNDNCPEVRNPSQSDLGVDGLGDDCDPARDPDAPVDSAWADRLADPGPGARPGAAAAYDAGRGVVVLFGGSADVATWEYDGAAWIRIETKTAPAARRGHRMVYDDTRGLILLFGGTSLAGEPFNDLWKYDGRAWKRIVTSISPPPRLSSFPGVGPQAASFGLAYDSARRLLVLFGGDRTGQTWVFDGARWRIVPTPRSPLPRFEPQMAYDPHRRLSVLHGGIDAPESGGSGAILFGDTWEFDGETWQEVDARGDIPPSWGGETVFDPGRRQVVTFGGEFERLEISFPPGLRVFSPWAATRLYDGRSWSLLPTRPTIAPQADHAAAFDVARGVLVVHGGILVDGETRGNTAELRRPPDSDADGVIDAGDNCPLAANPDQADRDHDGSGDACDNCPEEFNRPQRDLDRDGTGDACDGDLDGDGVQNRSDACPAAYVPGRAISSILEGGGPDSDGDGAADDCDPCPLDARDDADRDGICANLDNCPGSFNPLQEDSTQDRSGDACQPVLVLSGIQEDGGEVLEVAAVASDPDGDPLAGSIDFFTVRTFVLRSADVDNLVCDIDAYPPGLRPGEGIGYAAFTADEASLFDIASTIECNEGVTDFLIAPGRCDRPQSNFRPVLALQSAPAPICVARARSVEPPAGDRVDLTVLDFDETAVRVSAADGSPALRIPFSAGLPHRSLLGNLTPGTVYRLLITVTDGASLPVTAEDTFLYQGEVVMEILHRLGRPGARPGEPLPLSR